MGRVYSLTHSLHQLKMEGEMEQPIYELANTRKSGEHTPSPSLKNLTEEGRLPCNVVVHQTSYGEYSGLLGDGQELEVYFHKLMPIVTIKTTERDYTVPVNTTFLFSVLYNPTDDLIKARTGHIFNTVAELMSATPLPSAVHVGTECTCNTALGSGRGGEKNPPSTLKVGQLLVIVGLCTETRFGRNKTFLKCLALEDNESTEVYLKESCKGHFSTQESLLLFPLPLLLKHAKLPIMTSAYESKSQSLHPRFKNKYAIIEDGPSSLSSFIASTLHPIEAEPISSSSTSGQLIEMYTTLPLHYDIANKSYQELTQVKQNMSSMYQSLSPGSITAVLYSTGEVEALQSDFLSPLNNEEWMNQILLPPSIKAKNKLKKKKPPPPPPPPLLPDPSTNSGTTSFKRDKPPPLKEKPKLTHKKNKTSKQDGSHLPEIPSISSSLKPPSPSMVQSVEYDVVSYQHASQINSNPAYGLVTSPQGSEKSSAQSVEYDAVNYQHASQIDSNLAYGLVTLPQGSKKSSKWQ